MPDWLSISTADRFWLIKSIVLVLGVTSIPIILWYGFLGLVRRYEDKRENGGSC